MPRPTVGHSGWITRWVTGLQTHYHLGEAIGERRFMVVRFTPLGAHLFFHLSMDSLTDRAVPLEQVDPRIASMVSDHVMVARGWAGCAWADTGPAPYRAGVERVGEDLGTDARWIAG